MKYQGKRVDTEEPVEVTIHNGYIQAVEPISEEDGLPWLSPGWIDLQVNGFNGFDLNGDVTVADDVAGVTHALYVHGVTAYLPTVITGTRERIRQAMTAITEARSRDDRVNHSVIGIHLEGPYISEADGPRGAHDPNSVRDPDWGEFTEWQEAAGGNIRMVTLAPERKGAIAFIERLKRSGVVVSLGHTQADAACINEAVMAGATLSTHLGNGAHPLLPRHPNYIWDQLGEDRLWASFIADGHHLAPPVLKSMLRAKRDQFILVSDCVKFGGMPPGRYSSSIGSEVQLHDNGKLTIAANPLILAGSAQPLDWGVACAVRLAEIPLSDAVEAVTLRPAAVLDQPKYGRLEPGCVGNLVLFEIPDQTGRLAIRQTVVAGETVYTHFK